MRSDECARIAGVALSFVALIGCGDPEAEAAEARERALTARLESLGAAVQHEVLAARPERFACGKAEGIPARVLVASARQCMGCRDVAWLAREMARESAQDASFWIATSAADGPKVCEYLAAERAAGTVYVVSDRALRHAAATDDLVLVEMTGQDGARVYHAHDALLLVRAFRPGSETAAAAGAP